MLQEKLSVGKIGQCGIVYMMVMISLFLLIFFVLTPHSLYDHFRILPGDILLTYLLGTSPRTFPTLVGLCNCLL